VHVLELLRVRPGVEVAAVIHDAQPEAMQHQEKIALALVVLRRRLDAYPIERRERVRGDLFAGPRALTVIPQCRKRSNAVLARVRDRAALVLHLALPSMDPRREGFAKMTERRDH